MTADPRLHGDRGAGLVAGVVLIFAFTFGGLVWLARDVDRGVSNRSAAQSIAFQAARSGAQVLQIADLRRAGSTAAIDMAAIDTVAIDTAGARAAAMRTAATLFASYGVAGRVTSIAVGVDSVTVNVEITDGGIVVTGSGTVRAERAP